MKIKIMKENEPEKLYVALFKGEFNVSCSPTNNSVEYIRTDIFVEKAVHFVASNMRCNGFTLQTKAKILSELQKYLENETNKI